MSNKIFPNLKPNHWLRGGSKTLHGQGKNKKTELFEFDDQTDDDRQSISFYLISSSPVCTAYDSEKIAESFRPP